MNLCSILKDNVKKLSFSLLEKKPEFFFPESCCLIRIIHSKDNGMLYIAYSVTLICGLVDPCTCIIVGEIIS